MNAQDTNQTLNIPSASAPTLTDALESLTADPRIQAQLDLLDHPERVDFETLLPKTKGIGARADVKRRVRMLRAIEPRYDTLLYPDETIEYVALAVLNSWAEQYFMGIWAMTINRTLLVFTNYRVILIHADTKGRAKQQHWQIPYARLKKYRPGTLLGSVKFKLDDKRAYAFTGMNKRDRKALKRYMLERLSTDADDRFEFPSFRARDPLCPICHSPVEGRPRACPECAEPFVNPIVPAAASAIIPGTGDLYLGHTTLGIMEILGFVFLIFVAVNIIASDPADWWIAAGLIVAANAVDAAVTHHVARKGITAKRHVFGNATKPRKV